MFRNMKAASGRGNTKPKNEPPRPIESPVPHLLTSNDAPSESERILIQSEINRLQAEARSLTAAQPTPRKSNQERIAYVKRSTIAHRSLLSLIRTTPVELWQEIFTLSLGNEDREIWLCRLPWSISHVCKAWREIAFATPMLWSHLPTLYLVRRRSAEFIEILEQILERTAATPLTISLYFPDGFKDTEQRCFPTLTSLSKYAERWESLSISAAPIIINSFEHLVHGRLTSLRTLHLNLVNLGYEHPLGSIFEDAPNLRHVFVHDFSCSILRFPWLKLETYTGHLFQPVTMTSTQAFSSLKALELSARNMDWMFRDSMWLRLLDAFVLPCVESVKFVELPESAIRPFVNMLSRSNVGGHLRRLTIELDGEFGPTQDNFTLLLRHLPNLRYLDINVPDTYVVSALTMTPESTPLVPLLGTLILRISSAERLKDCVHRIKELAQSRASHKPSIRILLAFTQWEPCLRAQTLLSPWPTQLHEDNAVQALRDFRQRLEKDLPELVDEQPPRLRYTYLKLPQRLHDLLADIENHELPSAEALWASQLHVSLRKISHFSENQVPGEDRFAYRQHAAKILEKWDGVMHDLLSQLDWGLRLDNSLIYVPQGHEIRRHPAALSMLYGIDETLFQAYFPEENGRKRLGNM